MTSPTTRDDMTSFWQKHSVEASLNEMLLDSNAEEISRFELKEILENLPELKNLRILELGAGIG